PPNGSPVVAFPFAGVRVGYPDLVETRSAKGGIFAGPCAVWFRLRHPLVEGQTPSAYQRVAVAADSDNGISAVLDYERYSFVNSDLSINMLRPPVGDWICLDARTWLASNGCGLAESALYDQQGLIGRATQSLAVKAR
ncbi:MAG: thioesterase family protein, partial [Rhodoferax sp.]